MGGAKESETQKVGVKLDLVGSGIPVFNERFSMDATVQDLINKVEVLEMYDGGKVSIHRSNANVDESLGSSQKLKDLLAEDASSLELVCLIRPPVSLILKSDEKAGDYDLEETIISDLAGKEFLTVSYFPISISKFLKDPENTFPRIEVVNDKGHCPKNKFPKIVIANGQAQMSVGTYTFKSESENIAKMMFTVDLDNSWKVLSIPIVIDEEECTFSLEYMIEGKGSYDEDECEILSIRTRNNQIITEAGKIYGLNFKLKVTVGGYSYEAIKAAHLVPEFPGIWDPDDSGWGTRKVYTKY